MSIFVFGLFMAGMFGIGVWLGWHMAHINTRIDADLAESTRTGSLPASWSFDSAGQGAARPEPPTGAGRASQIPRK